MNGTTCWSCEKMAMEPDPELGHGWMKCSNCGATHHPSPTKMGVNELITEQVAPHTSETKYRPREQRTPKASAKAVSGKA